MSAHLTRTRLVSPFGRSAAQPEIGTDNAFVRSCCSVWLKGLFGATEANRMVPLDEERAVVHDGKEEVQRHVHHLPAAQGLHGHGALSARHTEAARVLSSRGQQRMAGAGFYTLLREQAKPKLPTYLPGCPSLSGRSGQTRTPMRCKQHW